MHELGKYRASILLLQLHDPALVRNHFIFLPANLGFTCVDTVAVILLVDIRGLVICATPMLLGKTTPTCEPPMIRLEAEARGSHS